MLTHGQNAACSAMVKETVGSLGVLYWILVFLAAAALVFLMVFYVRFFLVARPHNTHSTLTRRALRS